MQLTRAADYGARVMIQLASAGVDARMSLSELADAAEVPPAFLSKVLQRLVRARLIVSCRGKKGGFELLERGRAASLLDILEAVDGVPQLNLCMLPAGCRRSEHCAVHPVWKVAQDQLRETLAAATLEQLVAESRARQRAAAAGRP
jgi:Rrf2 family protein